MEEASTSQSSFPKPSAWIPWSPDRLSDANYPLLMVKQVERCKAVAERCIAAAERCRVATSSLEYTPCTEVYNALENCNEQLENLSPAGATCNGETAAGSLSVRTNTVGHVSPVVGAFAVQCARCLKWRLMPSKERYEAIRECILECPWICEDACLWRPNASCEDPEDIVPDEKYLWAMDKPNISVPPPGWDRRFVIRSRGASKLGDIYYISPCGKKLRSMVEVDRFLNEHPHYVMEGASLDRFSYKTPKALFEGYVEGRRKRSGESDPDGPIRKAQKIQRNINTTRDISRLKVMSFPEFSKKKRSTRMRPTAVVTTWNLSVTCSNSKYSFL